MQTISEKLKEIIRLTDEFAEEVKSLAPVEKTDGYSVEQFHADALKVAKDFIKEEIKYPKFLLCVNIQINSQNISYEQGLQHSISFYDHSYGLNLIAGLNLIDSPGAALNLFRKELIKKFGDPNESLV